MSNIVSEKSRKKSINHLTRTMPSLPKGSYTLELKDFLKLISKQPYEFRERLLKKYRQITAANAASSKAAKEAGGFYHSKLTDLQKMEIIELSGRYFSPAQIMQIIRTEWGIKYSNGALNNLLKNNKEMIYDKRKKYGNSIDGLRLVHERPRIEEYTNIYDESREVGDNKLALEVLKEIRQEVKGDKLVLEGNVNLNANINVKEHILKNTVIENFAKLAMMNLFEKHNIDFMKIAHRFKVEKVNVDPETGDAIEPRMLPVKVDDISILSDNKIKKNMRVEEATFTENVEEVKDKLISKIVDRKKELKKLNAKIDMREEVDKPEVLEKVKIQEKKKNKKGKREIEIKKKIDPKIIKKILRDRKIEVDKKIDKRGRKNQ